MQFDPKTLPVPERKWLTPFEAVNYLALGEALDTDMLARVDYPSTRAHAGEIEQSLERCRVEARTDPKCSDFLELVGPERRGPGPIVPPSSSLRACEPNWPPSGQRLYNVIVQWEQAQEKEDKSASEAEELIRSALVSGRVTFNGEREGRREDIDVRLFCGDPAFYLDVGLIEASSDQLSVHAGRTLRWTAVKIETASLMEWLDVTGSRPQNTKRGGAPVQYTTDDLIVEDVLAAIRAGSNVSIAQLIRDYAQARNCYPRTAKELYRLIDRVRRKVNRAQNSDSKRPE